MAFKAKLMEIDLSEQTVKERYLPNDILKLYWGGKGLGAKLLSDDVPDKLDPFDSGNPLIFISGPLTGTSAPSMRVAIVTKSPLSNTFSASYVGGHLGQEISRMGYMAVTIKGKADKPIYLVVTDGKVEFRNASHIWGRDTFETENQIKAETDPRYRVACIGQAGEKLVKFALINTEYYRQAGRCGSGSVMGSKNLKAVAFKSTSSVTLFDKDGFNRLSKELWNELAKSHALYRFKRWGTSASIIGSSRVGTLTVNNFREDTFDKPEALSGIEAEKIFWVKKKACFACPIHCGNLGIIRTGRFAGTIVEGPEYETTALLGSNCGIGNFEVLVHLNMLCDKYGIDSISTGNVMGFIIECCEKGILRKKDFGNYLPSWGDAESLILLCESIAYRKGIGNLLAEGVKIASEVIGQGSENFAMHVKGTEIAGWNFRSAPGMALAYATADRGADHQQAFPISYEVYGSLSPSGFPVERYETKGKATLVKADQDFISALNCLIVCDFAAGAIGKDRLVEMVNLATGWGVGNKDFDILGERVFNQTRLFNIRQGHDRKTDSLPGRAFELLERGPRAGFMLKREDFEAMLSEYYYCRDWDINTGVPTGTKLENLGIK
jgi:aldehyde:ferredoxin oxidoreductase